MQIVTPAEAVAGIRSGDQLYLQCAAATPSVLLDALVDRAAELHDVSVVHLHCETRFHRPAQRRICKRSKGQAEAGQVLH